MTLPPAVAYLSGLAFVAPDLPPPALFGTALALHVCDAILCRLFAHNNGYPKNLWTLFGFMAGLWAVAAVRLLRRGEDARLEARAGASLERAPDARDVAHVDAQADDHRDLSTRRRCGRWRCRRAASAARRTPYGVPRGGSACRPSARRSPRAAAHRGGRRGGRSDPDPRPRSRGGLSGWATTPPGARAGGPGSRPRAGRRARGASAGTPRAGSRSRPRRRGWPRARGGGGRASAAARGWPPSAPTETASTASARRG